jgi:hypothetical protein
VTRAWLHALRRTAAAKRRSISTEGAAAEFGVDRARPTDTHLEFVRAGPIYSDDGRGARACERCGRAR